MNGEQYKPSQRDLERFAEILHQTGDCVLAFRAIRPTGRLDVAQRRGPQLAGLPEVQTIVEELRVKPESLSDDERMMHHALSLADDQELSPRERLTAMSTYARLKKSVEHKEHAPGGFAPELRAFLQEQGIVIDGM